MRRSPPPSDRSGDEPGGPRWAAVLIPLLTLALVAPFLLKPPHIDEESYLFIASSILDHPGRPYDWWRPWQPFLAPAADTYLYAHPPLFLWWMALCLKLVGAAEILPLRLLQLPFVAGLAAATFSLARRVSSRPGRAALVLLLSPGLFLALHQSLMIDLLTLSLGLASVALAWPGLQGGGGDEGAGWPRPLMAGILLGLACITKYPALLFALGMVAVARAAGPGWARRLRLPLGVGMGILLAWELASWALYGAPHLYVVLTHAGEIARTPLASRAAATVSHLGLAVASPALIAAAALSERRGLRRAALCGALAAGLLGLLHLGAAWDARGEAGWVVGALAAASEGLPPRAAAEALLWLGFALGLAALGITARAAFDPRGRPEDRGLAQWALLAIAGVALTHNFVGARYLALGAAPLGLVLWRALERGPARREALANLILAATLALGLVVGRADLLQAEITPALLARLDASKVAGGCRSVAFAGEWGFRFEAERRGWARLPPEGLSPGQCAVVAEGAAPEPALQTDGLELLGVFATVEGAPLLRTHDPGEGIGYYSDAFGLLPYGPGSGPLESLSVWWRPPR